MTSVIEHPAVQRPCEWLEAQGWKVTRLPVDAGGRIRIDVARAAITREVALATAMHSHNETGVLQPIAELARLAHEVGALVHTDAAQSVGRVPIRVSELDVDLLSIAGHKLHAPKGVGALYARRGIRLTPLLLGADHEGGVRPGTENVASIVGLGAACAAAGRDLAEVAARVRRLRDDLFAQLGAAVPGLALNGAGEPRLPNTLNVRFPGVSGAELLANAPEVSASTGSACHAGRIELSPVLKAMGIAPEIGGGAIRFSLGRATTEGEIDAVLSLISRRVEIMG